MKLKFMVLNGRAKLPKHMVSLVIQVGSINFHGQPETLILQPDFHVQRLILNSRFHGLQFVGKHIGLLPLNFLLICHLPQGLGLQALLLLSLLV